MISSEYLSALSKAVKYESEGLSTKMQKQIKDLELTDYYEEDIAKELAVSDGQRKVSWQRAIPDDYTARKYKNAKLDMKSQINKLKKNCK